MEYLMENRVHPTANKIYHDLSEKIPTLSQTTVYNTLKLFMEQGALHALNIDDKNVRFDIDTSCHAHFQCCGCGEIFDVPVGSFELLHPRRVGDLLITECSLYYKGYCKNCNKKSQESPDNHINQKK